MQILCLSDAQKYATEHFKDACESLPDVSKIQIENLTDEEVPKSIHEKAIEITNARVIIGHHEEDGSSGARKASVYLSKNKKNLRTSASIRIGDSRIKHKTLNELRLAEPFCHVFDPENPEQSKRCMRVLAIFYLLVAEKIQSHYKTTGGFLKWFHLASAMAQKKISKGGPVMSLDSTTTHKPADNSNCGLHQDTTRVQENKPMPNPPAPLKPQQSITPPAHSELKRKRRATESDESGANDSHGSVERTQRSGTPVRDLEYLAEYFRSCKKLKAENESNANAKLLLEESCKRESETIIERDQLRLEKEQLERQVTQAKEVEQEVTALRREKVDLSNKTKDVENMNEGLKTQIDDLEKEIKDMRKKFQQYKREVIELGNKEF